MGTRELSRHVCASVASGLLVVLAATSPSAKPVTYVKEYTYQASEIDSKVTSRTIALEQVKRLLLEELGTYLISETAVKDMELTKDQIVSFTAGIVMTVILEEKWDGKTYVLQAKISTETDELLRDLRRIQKNPEQSAAWEDVRAKTDRALHEIEQLKKELASKPGAKGAQETYAKAVNQLTAVEWFRKAMQWVSPRSVTAFSEKGNQEALHAFDKTTELDPTYARAYAGRANIYNNRGNFAAALRESEQALKLDPDFAWGLNCRGNARAGLLNFTDALQDFGKAIALAPKYFWTYCNRSRTYGQLRDYPHALEDANKALELNPELACGHFNRGLALVALNQVPDAITSFDKVIALDPTFGGGFFQRGQALVKGGKPDQALDDFKQAAKLGHGGAREYLKKRGISW